MRRGVPHEAAPTKRCRPAFSPLSGAAVALTAAAVALGACDQPTAQTPAAAPPPPEVTVSHPLRRPIAEWDEYSGRFGAVATVEVRARVGGALENVHFQDGQIVRQGELLFSIDQRPYQTALQEAQGRLAEARSRHDLALRELGRANELRRSNTIPERQLDERAEAVRSAIAAIAIAEAQVRRAQLDIEWTRVTAPITGRIGRHLVSPGNIIAGGDASATLLAAVVSIDPIDFYFDVDQATYLRYQRQAPGGARPSSREMSNQARLALGDETLFNHVGRMNFVDNVADQQTGVVRGRARFANPEELFTPGVFARIRLLNTTPRQALLLPDEAIGTDQSRRVVLVVGEDNRVALREVRPGRLVEGLRVIETGLEGGELVVVNGLQRARAGAPVTPARKEIEPTPVAEEAMRGLAGDPRR
jgi:membrane fusion protein, multidrug efflux system